MNHNIRVLKYGGTSVASNEKIKEIAAYLKKQKEKLIVVVSAMNKTTDELLKQIHEISLQPPKAELDLLLSLGEQKTVALMSTALNNINVKAKALNAHALNICTNGEHTKAKIKHINTQKIYDLFKTYDVLVVTGFQGVDETSQEITTLGRGGSDLSATALACCLNVNVEIYTDTTGVFSLDPRINSKAIKLKTLSYEEMMEMSIKGSGVIEPRSIALAKKYNINIYLAKSLSSIHGTWINSKGDYMENKVISGLSLDQDVLQVTISNFNLNISHINYIFKQISKLNINIDMITTDNINQMSFTCHKNEINEVTTLKNILQTKINDVIFDTNTNLSKVSLIGIGMNQESGVASKVFSALDSCNVDVNLITTSNISISLLICKQETLKCVNALANEFKLLEENNV